MLSGKWDVALHVIGMPPSDERGQSRSALLEPFLLNFLSAASTADRAAFLTLANKYSTKQKNSVPD
jgi:hypothetical protein